MSSKKSKDEPELDPYDVLGIEPGVSDSAINKAYRKLALKLHPDKQQSMPTDKAEQIAKEFHNVKEARAFLLDAEFRDARQKYDAKRASIQRRRQADAQRNQSMNKRRKDMQDELKQREEEALSGSRNKSHKKSKKSKYDDELMEKLRKEGAGMRQAYAEKEAEAAETAAARNEVQQEKLGRKQRERLLQDRQIRFKWSRKKMTTSPSEHSLATLLSRFGSVEEVEMLGSKGNLALITFADPASCRPCVESYKNSEEMRASYVGKRKEEEEARDAAKEQQEEELARASSGKSDYRDNESLYDRKLRQAQEREALLRQMEAEESGRGSRSSAVTGAEKEPANLSSRAVMVQFPSTEEYRHLSPIAKLGKAEREILGNILNPDNFARLREFQS